MRFARLLIALGLAALSGCATILGLEHNDGVDGGTADAPDSGREAADRQPMDARADRGDGGSTPLDANPGRDGRVSDALTDRRAPCDGGFCACVAPDAQFCADFDEADPLAGLAPMTDGGPFDEAGVIVVDTEESVSPPHSLKVAGPGNNFGTVTLLTHTAAAGATSRYDLRFEVWLGECAGSALTQAFALISRMPSRSEALSLLSVDGGTAVVQGSVTAGGGTSFADAPMPIAPGQWTQVELLVDLAAGTSTATVGALTRQTPLELFTDGEALLPTVAFSIGQEAAPSRACVLFFDNVTWSALP